jgi:hypothetical protein
MEGGNLEEAKENYSGLYGEKFEIKNGHHFVNTFEIIENAFDAGANWQKKRMLIGGSYLDNVIKIVFKLTNKGYSLNDITKILKQANEDENT